MPTLEASLYLFPPYLLLLPTHLGSSYNHLFAVFVWFHRFTISLSLSLSLSLFAFSDLAVGIPCSTLVNSAPSSLLLYSPSVSPLRLNLCRHLLISVHGILLSSMETLVLEVESVPPKGRVSHEKTDRGIAP